MMFMCSQKFTLDNKQFSYRGNILAEEDNQVTREVESALKATEDEFDPISDCEEDAAEEDPDVGLGAVEFATMALAVESGSRQ